MGIQGTAYQGEYDELCYWQEKYVRNFYNYYDDLLFTLIFHICFRLMKQIFSRMLKPWLYPESIFSLTENAKQTRIAKKILQDFFHSVNLKDFIYNYFIIYL